VYQPFRKRPNPTQFTWQFGERCLTALQVHGEIEKGTPFAPRWNMYALKAGLLGVLPDLGLSPFTVRSRHTDLSFDDTLFLFQHAPSHQQLKPKCKPSLSNVL
jgi:hypothetical protein